MTGTVKRPQLYVRCHPDESYETWPGMAELADYLRGRGVAAVARSLAAPDKFTAAGKPDVVLFWGVEPDAGDARACRILSPGLFVLAETIRPLTGAETIDLNRFLGGDRVTSAEIYVMIPFAVRSADGVTFDPAEAARAAERIVQNAVDNASFGYPLGANVSFESGVAEANNWVPEEN
jgi:hypothetical protein